jgi:26S proteasome regulatory subunit N13
VDLSSSLTLEALQPLLTNEDFMRRVRESLPTGEGEGDDHSTTSLAFASTVQSPQFQQALSTFSSALQSGQLGPLIQQFALGQECVDAANAGGNAHHHPVPYRSPPFLIALNCV